MNADLLRDPPHRVPPMAALAFACALLAALPGGVVLAQQPSQPATANAASKPGAAVFSSAELDQMLAPIALYPDSLLAQVLMASTYPGEVADAAAWAKANPQAKGDDAVKKVADKPWDPSVQALVAFPQVLGSLGQDNNWVTRLGDAFLAEPDRVMDSVQRLRAQAQKAGNLQTNEYQNVSTQPATGIESTPQTIVIESKDPEVVYVPSYNPSYVYGSWGWGGYPPYYYPPPGYWYPGAALGAGIMFGIGVGIVGGLWGDCDWGSGDININSERYNNFERNVNRESNRGDRQGNRQDRQANRQAGNGKWQHDSAHREGTPYRDQGTRDRFEGQRQGADNRFRGDTPGRAQQRDQARASMDRAGMQSPARSNMDAQNRARQTAGNPGFENRGGQGGFNNPAPRNNQAFQQRGQNNMQSRDAARGSYGGQGARNNAFSGAGSGNYGAASQRGRSSSSMSRSGGSRGGASRSMSRPPMSRGGGGRRR